MDNILKLMKHTFLIKGVKKELEKSKVKMVKQQDQERFHILLKLAGTLLAMAAVLYSVQGYHAGFHSINDLGPLLPSELWQMTTYFGDTATALCLMLFFARRNPSALWIIFIAAIVGLLVTHSMKASFGMMRPPAVLDDSEFNVIGKAFNKGSFPSGHSFSIFVFVTTLFYFSKQVGTRIVLVVFGVIVAASRIIVGAHWPIDTLVGSALGILITLSAIYIAKRSLGGLSILVHFIIVSLLLTATVMLFTHDGGYPSAGPLGKVLATVTLAFFISEYFLTPYVRSRAPRVSHVS